MVSQPGQLHELQANGRPCLHKWWMLPEEQQLWLSSGLHMHVCMCEYGPSHENMHVNTSTNASICNKMGRCSPSACTIATAPDASVEPVNDRIVAVLTSWLQNTDLVFTFAKVMLIVCSSPCCSLCPLPCPCEHAFCWQTFIDIS